VRGDDPRRSLGDFDGAILARNDQGSQSDHAAPLVAAERVWRRFGARRLSGAHVASARMVADNLADIACLDAVSWRHIRRYDPWAAGLRVLGWTEPTPRLPFITAVAPLAPILFDSLACAIEGMPNASRSVLTLRGGVRIDPAAYLAVSDPVGDRR
jgi:ABC-type phosphate/phosphonate transport system substrate-binding protein